MAKFDDAVTSLMLTHPFFSQLLLKFNVVATDSIPTLAVTAKDIVYSPKFMEQLDDESGVFVVAHEVMHAVHEHVPMLARYAATGIGPDGKAFDANRMNRAMDFVNNAALVLDGFRFNHTGFKLCLDPAKYPHTLLAEEVYCMLPDDPGGSGGGGGRPLDTHDATSGEQSVITPADIIAAAAHHKKVMGKDPAGMERVLGTLRKPKSSPWARLRNKVAEAVNGRGHMSWRRLNRPMVVRSIYMPTRRGMQAGRVGVVVDTSGSISSEVLNMFAGHMAAIIDDAQPKEVLIYWCDSKVAGSGKVRNGNELRSFLRKGAKGGGGTDMTVGVNRAITDKCDVVVVLTDGYTPFGAPTKTPVTWAITTQVKAPHGTTIHIT